MQIESWLTGRRGVGLPFTDECAPLGKDTASVQALFAQVSTYAKQQDWKYLEFRGGRSLFGDVPVSTEFLGHQLNLAEGEAAVFSRTDSSTRRAVRKGEESKLTVESSQTLAAVRAFYGLLCLTRKRHGLPAQPFRFFAQIHQHVLAQNQGCVFLARKGTTPVAGAVFFHFGRTVVYKYGASDERFQQLRANNLVMATAIKSYIKQGFEILDFGRTSLSNEGLRRFKLGWGTVERTIEYVRYDLAKGMFVTVRDEAFGWYNRVFQVLPVSVSRLAGAVLYQHAA